MSRWSTDGASPPPGRAVMLDELTTLVLAPNPGPMTLQGTNTYLLGRPGDGSAVVVDPGPDDAAHRAAVEAALGERDAEVAAVVLTHHHADHAEAAPWAARWGAPLHAFDPSLVPGGAQRLGDDQRLPLAGVTLQSVHTPGHSSDHLCLRVVETDAVLSGDHVLGEGTTVVAWPDGDMAAYLRSLDRLAATSARVLYPGHGPPLADPAAVVAEYRAHRRAREEQILRAVADGCDTTSAIVEHVYADVDPALHPAAARSVRAHLDKLTAEGRVRRAPAAERAEREDRYRV